VIPGRRNMKIMLGLPSEYWRHSPPANTDDLDPEGLVQRACMILSVEIAQFLASDSGRNQLAFAQWCREHGHG
jgi:hypothetical protein